MPNLILLLVAVIAWAGQSERPVDPGAHPQQHADSASDGKQNRTSPPAAHTPVPAPGGERDAEEHAEQHEDGASAERELVRATWVLVGVTGVLALFTGFLFGATWLLARDARATANRQHTQTENSLAIARESADAARESARATRASVAQMEATAKRQLRPYLIAKVGGIAPQNAITGRPLIWAPEIWNTGQTPAYKVRCVTWVQVLPFPLSRDHKFDTTHTDFAGQMTLGSGEHLAVETPAPRVMTANELESVQQRQKLALYVYGTAHYQDTFGDDHRTNFCFYAVWDGPNDIHGNVTYQHNDAD